MIQEGSGEQILGPSASEIIRRCVGKLAPAEHKVALMLLPGNSSVSLDSSSRLATSVEMSRPTITRFVNQLAVFITESLSRRYGRKSTPVALPRMPCTGATSGTRMSEAWTIGQRTWSLAPRGTG